MKHYRLFNSGSKQIIPVLTESPKFHTLGLYAGDYGFYTKEYQTRKLPEPITVEWVTQEQIKNGIPVHPFTHTTLGLESDLLYTPPFHVQVICPFNYRRDILDSVWLLNEVTTTEGGTTYRKPMRELDLFESGSQNVIPNLWQRPRLWFADHWAEYNYNNRQSEIVELVFPPTGESQIDLFIYPGGAKRYLNGRLIKSTVLDLNYPFRLLVTLIVNTPDAKDCDWNTKITME